MKPLIATVDFTQMQKVLQARKSNYGRYLEILINRYEQVSEKAIGKGGVRLNSVVELWHEILHKQVKFQVVLPEAADLKKRKLSVFAPVCLAILGRNEGDYVETDRAGIRKKYKIVKVKN